MFEEHEVAMARWVHQAASGAGAAARRDVTMFAQRHGMAEATARDVGVAVCRAVPYAADGSAALRSRVVVEAATDGEWLSVRIDGDADRSGGDADVVLDLLVCELADRFEFGTPWRGTGTSVLMEFAMTAAEAPGATPAWERRIRVQSEFGSLLGAVEAAEPACRRRRHVVAAGGAISRPRPAD